MLPPYELKNKDFSKVMRGYNPSEVDEHITFIIDKYTELYRENDELERKLKSAYAKLDEIKNEEESIRNAMVNAQRASNKIMTEANDRADIIINTARKSCDRILADFRKKIQEERAILSALNTAITEFKDKLFKTYNSHIAFVEGVELLDEEEIIKYALSDENYTSAVIQNIKQDIINMSSDREDDAIDGDKVFAEANPMSQEPAVRSTSVKDTIKELNKRILEEDDIVEEVAEDAENVTEEVNDKTEEEIAAEKEYGEMLKQLGIDSPVDTDDAENDNTNSSERSDDFNQAYHTPKNYGEVIKRKFKR